MWRPPLAVAAKRAFDKSQQSPSKGFEELAMPSNKEALLIAYNEKRSLQMADEHK